MKFFNLLVLMAAGAAIANGQTRGCSLVGDFPRRRSTSALDRSMESPNGSHSVQVEMDNQARLTTFHVRSNNAGRPDIVEAEVFRHPQEPRRRVGGSSALRDGGSGRVRVKA
jgi:hypothetical protein